jgi:S1-C subfamily serine protease
VWDVNGHVVTNFHVVAEGTSFTVTLADKKEYDAELVGVEPFKDLAVLKIEAPRSVLATLVTVQPGNSEALIVGQKVIAIGNPFGLDQTLTTGVISALGREIKSMRNTTIHDVIQTDASINPGNSGGPLLDSGGRLIGVNTAIFSTSGASAGIGFAVPVEVVKRVVPQLITRGRVTRAGLGIVPFSDEVGRRFGGLPIQDVPARGGAARAGLKGATMDRYGRVSLGDVILAVDGKEVRTFDDLYLALENRNPGDRVKVRYRRGQRELETEVVLQAIE